MAVCTMLTKLNNMKCGRDEVVKLDSVVVELNVEMAKKKKTKKKKKKKHNTIEITPNPMQKQLTSQER